MPNASNQLEFEEEKEKSIFQDSIIFYVVMMILKDSICILMMQNMYKYCLLPLSAFKFDCVPCAI